MFIKSILYRFTFLSLLFATPFSYAQNLNTFAEYGANIHTGDNTPLWQVSNQHGFSSIKNNTYVRGGVFYKDTIHTWILEAGVDMAIATGFTSTFVVQQAYADVRYKWIGLYHLKFHSLEKYLSDWEHPEVYKPVPLVYFVSH